MPASRNDQAILAANPLFIARVAESLVSACISIGSEAVTTSFHYRRAAFSVAVLNNPTAYQSLFALTVATDANVIADATQAGTVVLTAANIAAQQALVTDAHIDSAVSGQYNSFFSPA